MTDTTSKTADYLRELTRSKTPEERLRMGCSMYDLAKEIVVSSILEQDPDISFLELREKVFLRFYGSDFDGPQGKKDPRFP